MSLYVKFLHVLANTLASLCYQGYELRQTVREMKVLQDVTRLLTSTLDLQQVLNLIVRNVTEVLGVKACSLRLLDPTATELVVKAVHNLSTEYLNKGPVLLERSDIDRSALRGELVFVRDMRRDPRILYPKEAEREGLCSSLAVALRYQDKPVGVLHIYTGEPHDFDQSEVALFRALADVAAVAIENARLYQESVEKQYLENELIVAASIQSRLLPSSAPRSERIEIDARSVQSKRVGGDFYDFIPIGDSLLGIAIADVSGKGTPGALLMASARASLRALIESGVDTVQVVRRLNQSLVRDTGSDEFVSLFFAELDADSLAFTYTNAGHNSPILLRRKEISRLGKGGMVLGVSEKARFEHETVRLQSGDMIVLYTDGVTDSRNHADELFGEERLLAIVRRLSGSTAAQTVETIHLEVEEFSEGVPQFDDRTVMAIKVK
jgi:sigma-B regulation protein RsbU (phosphoserine phosphatase)